MPDSREFSTVDVLMGTEPIVYDPAILASILRSMGKIEIDLLQTGLTNAQRLHIARLREYRSVIWRMLPEGL